MMAEDPSSSGSIGNGASTEQNVPVPTYQPPQMVNIFPTTTLDSTPPRSFEDPVMPLGTKIKRPLLLRPFLWVKERYFSELIQEISTKKELLKPPKGAEVAPELQQDTVRVKAVHLQRVPGVAFLSRLTSIVLHMVWFLTRLRKVFATGKLRNLKREFMFNAFVILVCVGLYGYGRYVVHQQHLAVEDLMSCHVCMDTSQQVDPPCSPVTESDFTTYDTKLQILNVSMATHVRNDDGHRCIYSFHVGSKACAVAVKDFLTETVMTYMNPIEISSKWADKPDIYIEYSDFFPNVKLARKRPSMMHMSYMDYDKKNSSFVLKSVKLYGVEAACAADALEVLNGTHHALYKAVSTNGELPPGFWTAELTTPKNPPAPTTTTTPSN